MTNQLNHFLFHSILTTFLLVQVATGQNTRIPEQDLSDQSAFIEANREMILGNLEKAESQFTDLVRKHPDQAAIFYALAQIQFAREDFPNALTNIRKARGLDMENVWYAILEGDILEQTGRYQDAANLFAQLARSHPKEEHYYEQWAFFLIKAGNANGAIDVYGQMEQELGFQEDISRKKYMLYRGMGQFEKAGQVLEEVVRRQPWNLEVQYTLAAFYEENGATAKARQWYQSILDDHPGESEARLALARMANPANPDGPLLGLGPIFQDPKADLDEKIKTIIPYIQAYANQQDVSLGQDLDSLARLLDDTHPGNAKVASILGDLAFYRQDYRSAIAAYQKALERERTIYPIWDQLLQALSLSHAYAEQVDIAEQALDVFPNQGKVHYYLAEGFLEAGRPEDALSTIHVARLMAGKDGFLLYHLAILQGRANARMGQAEMAASAFTQALALNPGGAEALAYRSLSLRDPGQKCADAHQSAQTAPANEVVRFALADCAFSKGDYNEARQQLEGLITGTEYPHPNWEELLGDTLALTGNIQGALTYWQKAADHGSASPNLARKIANLRYEE
ncbi:MAG: tetratricopeptide repeat protein [Saprospiraceae bacterium]